MGENKEEKTAKDKKTAKEKTGKRDTTSARRETSAKRSSSVKRPAAERGRVRVQNHSDDPFDETDIPPFDANEESVADTVFQETNEEKKSTGTTSRTRQRKKATSSGRGGEKNRSRRDAEPVPSGERRIADVLADLQPYVIFALGIFLAIEMVLTFAMNGGAYGWTRETHPFRWLGYYLDFILFGLLGYGAYLLPAGMIYLSLDRLRHGKRRTGKGLMATGIVLLLPMLIHVGRLHRGALGTPQAAQLRELYTSGAAHTSGGVLPGLLGYVSYAGLGVIGTMIIGIFFLLLLVMLLIGVTPIGIWEMIRGRYRQRRDDRQRAYEKEREMRQERGLAPRNALTREIADPSQRRDEEMERKIRRRLDREQEKMELEALKEAERSDRLERAKAAKRAAGRKEPPIEKAPDEFDPMDALLQREQPKEDIADESISQSNPKKKKRGKSSKAESIQPDFVATVGPMQPEEVWPPEADEKEGEASEEDSLSSLFEDVTDLPEVEDPAEATAKGPLSRAAEIPPEEDQDEPEEESLRNYPEQAEIELDLDEPLTEDEEINSLFTVSADTEDPAGAIAAADPTQMYEDMGGDASEDEDETLSTVIQANGGVSIHVETLSDEERMRGATVVTPEEKQEYAKVRPYTFPKIDLLVPEPAESSVTEAMLQQKAIRLRDTLNSFNVRVESVVYVGGPTVTRYEVRPAPGVKVASITRLADDIAMGLESAGAVRIEAPIPGKNAVGIEVPNDKRSTVYLRGLIDSEAFRSAKSRVTCCLGKGVGGMAVYLDINKMPHLLIAGATGTGKSVCINSLIMSLLYKAKPEEVKLLMIDPKTVEFSVYKDIPHLMAPIICDPKRAAGALNLAVQEMERRYELMRTVGVRNLAGYNAVTENDRYEHPYIPQMVIIIDELADLMMTAKNEVEASIVRLAQKARAAGIHLILGTQRPSVDVITGLIKANVPSRISFTVTSQVDSRTILDNAGAEKLLGVGDMLYSPIGSSKPQRVQGCFVSDDEVETIVDFIRRNNDEVRYDQNFLDNLDREAELIGNKRDSRDDYGDEGGENGDLDPKFYEALEVAVKNKRISTSLLQRAISVGYGRAAKILDQMEDRGFIGPASGNKPRDILISEEAYRELMINRD